MRPIEGGNGSPAFEDWLAELHAEDDLEAGDVLSFLAAPSIDMNQKIAVLETYVEAQPSGAAFPDAERWRNRLATLLQTMEFPADMGLKMGRVLTRVANPETQAKLEAHYAAHRDKLSEGNKLAIVMGSKDERFLSSVVDDRNDDVSVRERALSRLGRLGHVDRARETAAGLEDGDDPRLALTAMRIAGTHAEDRAALEELAETAKRPFATDELGRNAQDLAHVGISESKVSGKSAVMLGSWEQALRRQVAAATPEEELLRTLVLGKALVRALWTEGDPELAAGLLHQRVLPMVKATLVAASAQKNLNPLQVIGDFSLEFRRECTSRPVSVCDDSADPRVEFAPLLAAIVAPYLVNTEMSFYVEVE